MSQLASMCPCHCYANAPYICTCWMGLPVLFGPAHLMHALCPTCTHALPHLHACTAPPACHVGMWPTAPPTLDGEAAYEAACMWLHAQGWRGCSRGCQCLGGNGDCTPTLCGEGRAQGLAGACVHGPWLRSASCLVVTTLQCLTNHRHDPSPLPPLPPPPTPDGGQAYQTLVPHNSLLRPLSPPSPPSPP